MAKVVATAAITSPARPSTEDRRVRLLVWAKDTRAELITLLLIGRFKSKLYN
jgi:hypothetical protein